MKCTATLPWVAAECVNEWELPKMDGEMSMMNCDQAISHHTRNDLVTAVDKNIREDHNSRFKLLKNGISKYLFLINVSTFGEHNRPLFV